MALKPFVWVKWTLFPPRLIPSVFFLAPLAPRWDPIRVRVRVRVRVGVGPRLGLLGEAFAEIGRLDMGEPHVG